MHVLQLVKVCAGTDFHPLPVFSRAALLFQLPGLFRCQLPVCRVAFSCFHPVFVVLLRNFPFAIIKERLFSEKTTGCRRFFEIVACRKWICPAWGGLFPCVSVRSAKFFDNAMCRLLICWGGDFRSGEMQEGVPTGTPSWLDRTICLSRGSYRTITFFPLTM